MFEHVGLALRVLRELKGISQARLARQAGLGKSQLSKYENGKDLPKLDSLAKVLSALEAEPLALFYLDHFLVRLAAQESCEALLIDTKFGPEFSDSQRGFTRLLDDILLLFKAQIEARIRGAGSES
jgi:transcriptional regulator with XRE-family HTH domain